jgi:hypothetical protein
MILPIRHESKDKDSGRKKRDSNQLESLFLSTIYVVINDKSQIIFLIVRFNSRSMIQLLDQ